MTIRPPGDQAIEVTLAPERRPPSNDLGASQAGALLRVLFDAHAGYVWNTLRRLGAPGADLEDLTHDVFVQVHRRLADYDPARPVRPWLFAFAYRIASQHRRRAHRRHEIAGEPDATADPAPAAEERLRSAEDRRLVVDALASVAEERRAVFVLHEIDGTPMKDIAAALAIPVNTAYSRLRVAREEFAAAVKRLRLRRSHP